jgi:hemoglobin
MITNLPVVTPPNPKPNPHFERIGGEPAIRRIVTRFYEQMDQDEDLRHLRALHGPDLGPARDKLFDFLCGWMGGPPYFEQKYGHPRLRQRHMHVPIDEQGRDQWMTCIGRALAAEPIPDDFRTELLAAFFKTADFLRNQPPR